ncbi:unnamed protein product [Timema podura]|uniref:Uncharacterized protein n=1 Tax=Timema podura TaxID=61482 RepID=A0ABN7PCL5_TIMPD|nr:unnamed protein product [Timema podura]
MMKYYIEVNQHRRLYFKPGARIALGLREDILGGMSKVGLKESVLAFSWRENGKPFRKSHPKYTCSGPNRGLPNLGSLVYCEISALDHTGIKASTLSKLIGGM